MRRVAEFCKVFDPEAEAERTGPTERRRTLLNEEAGEAGEALATLAEGLRTGDDPVTAYQAVSEEPADVLYVTYGAADVPGIDLPAVYVEAHRPIGPT
ncbi:hypothetical protein PWG71_28380 [Nocardiopsis sp. N85]|uniref:hypothetical protein n=1 Tax=Nocardiopsis sp. N85 TaxID=3029400 RepID=UPI00237F0590|nr:hypothetical protein [Nocardiopsis sp. N85]MDE3725314.1 hypothetical protein [Nocardiopsis sp. N85]